MFYGPYFPIEGNISVDKSKGFVYESGGWDSVWFGEPIR